MITSLEIKQKVFSKALRGYDKHEVHAFLSSLSKEWERIHIERKDLRLKLEECKRDVGKLRDVEDSLFKAIKNAENTRTNVMEQASKTAELHMKEMQIKSDAMMSEAQAKAKGLLEQAESRSMNVVHEAQQEIRKLEKHQLTLETHRDNLLNNLRMIAKEVLYKVDRLEKGQPKSPLLQNHMQKVKDMEYGATESPSSSPSKRSVSSERPFVFYGVFLRVIFQAFFDGSGT